MSSANPKFALDEEGESKVDMKTEEEHQK